MDEFAPIVDPPLPKRFAERRRAYETLVVGGLLGGAALAVASGLAVFFHPPWTRVGVWLLVLGLAVLAATTRLAHPVWRLRTLANRGAGGSSYERLKRYNRLKASSISLNLITIVSTIFILGAYLSRIDLFDFGGVSASFVRSIGFVSVAILANFAHTFLLSLRTPPMDRSERREGLGLFDAMAFGSVGFAVLGGAVTVTPLRLGMFEAGPLDSSFFLLTAVTLLSVGLFVSRSLPTVYSLFSDHSEYYKSSYESRNRMIVLPSLVAFSLLFFVLVLAGLFEMGSNRLLITLQSHTFLFGAIGFVAMCLGVGLWISLRIARMEDKLPLYRARMSLARRHELLVLIASATMVAICLAATLWLALGHSLPGLRIPSTRWPEVLAVAVLCATGPYGFYHARRMKRIRRLEQRFPDFLRDIAGSRKAGLTLPASVTVAANGTYGELTPEIQKMADQLSLNIPFDEALKRFGQRVDTPLVKRDVLLITQAGRAGGQITDVLEAAAADAREVKTLETERRSTMSLYTIVIYIIFAVFLVVIAILQGSFIPPYLKAASAAQGADMGGVVFAEIKASSFRTFYFIAALVQAVGNGFIAGLFESGRALSGLRHSFIMVVITLVSFVLLLP